MSTTGERRNKTRHNIKETIHYILDSMVRPSSFLLMSLHILVVLCLFFSSYCSALVLFVQDCFHNDSHSLCADNGVDQMSCADVETVLDTSNNSWHKLIKAIESFGENNLGEINLDDLPVYTTILFIILLHIAILMATILQNRAAGIKSSLRKIMPQHTLLTTERRTSTTSKSHACKIKQCAVIFEARLQEIVKARNKDHSPLCSQVKEEILAYVTHIEGLYNDVEYHNFEHAFHVFYSMNGLLTKLQQSHNDPQHNGPLADRFNDPIVIFALIFSALVHDVAHTGKSNQILADHNHTITKQYSHSYAERFSIDLSLEVLFMDEYTHFRSTLMPETRHKVIFGKILFCSILITDIANSNSMRMGKARYHLLNYIRETYQDDVNKADEEFQDYPCIHPLNPVLEDIYSKLCLTNHEIEKYKNDLNITTKNDLELCVLIEHIMQISDVVHNMQDWRNFIKWNYRLYKELMVCHSLQLMPDPSENWNTGQIAFMDKYVVPLAERTETNLGNFANLVSLVKENMNKWESCGKTITQNFVEAVKNNESEEEVLRKCCT